MAKNRLQNLLDELYLRLVEVVGVFIVFVALATFVALVSYCAEDPSWNTAIDGSVANFLGMPGSHYSDIMMQAFGASSYLLSVVVFAFGYQLMKEHRVFFPRFLAGICAMPLCDFALAMGDVSWCRVGFVGKLLCKMLPAMSEMNKTIVLCVVAILCVAALVYAVKFSISDLEFNKIPLDKITQLDFLHREEVDEEDYFTKSFTVEDVVEEPTLKPEKKVAKKREAPKEQLSLSHVARNFHRPPFDLLSLPKEKEKRMTEAELKARSDNLITVLNDFGIQGEIIGASPGPVVTLYELKPAAGIKSSRVIGLSSDIARYMSAVSARVAVIPGRNALGIELPNEKRQTVYLREILESPIYKKSAAALPVTLGKDIGGEAIVADLARMPHLLIAGTTGSGKSVGINAMIMSLLYKLSPDECKFIMVDPKMLELSVYNDIPHLLTPVVTDPKKAVVALKWAVHEMESRYVSMSKLGVRNIEGYNSKLAAMAKTGETLTRQVHTGFDPETGAPIYETQTTKLDPIPYIVIIVDEMADLMLVAGKEIEIAVQRLAQMARAAGIHLVMATQRPSVDVITGTIKANFPTRISFQVSSKIDSRTILGEQGAEQLLGQGDMLYMASGGRTIRIHCPFVSDEEVEKVTNCLKQQGEPQYIDDILMDEDEEMLDDAGAGDSGDDPMYREAVNLVLREGKVSTSFLQRKLKLGYNRAARIVDMMEAAGIVSAANHVGKREVLGK